MAHCCYPPLVPTKFTKVLMRKFITKKPFCQKVAFSKAVPFKSRSVKKLLFPSLSKVPRTQSFRITLLFKYFMKLILLLLLYQTEKNLQRKVTIDQLRQIQIQTLLNSYIPQKIDRCVVLLNCRRHIIQLSRPF